MATLKHINSKNADYGAAEKYLTFEHDEFTMKPTLDENGRLIAREDYRISTLNCGDEDFAIACMRANLRFGKNQKREDVKSHHYIISFDPRDSIDNGLTVDRAQELSEQFCREHFAGHQALVCTHPDGHNHSKNIHVHIVINSLRIEEVPLMPYMDRPSDTKAGMKHRCTDATMEYLKSEVMDMCHRENLYQIDLLHGSENRVTEGEYWARRKGQAELEKQSVFSDKPTKFETDKEKLRQIIRAALANANSFDEFAELLLRQGVAVKESRGRLSYLTSDRTKPITARRLGDAFDLTAISAILEKNAAVIAVQTSPISEYSQGTSERLQSKKSPKIDPKSDSIQRLVDISAKRAEGKGIGYEKWAAMHNLKQMSATLIEYEKYGFSSPEDLDSALAAANNEMQDIHTRLKSTENALREKKELLRQVSTYIRLKPVRDGLRELKSDKARAKYREQHTGDFILSETAERYFKEHGITKLPSRKGLQTEIERLTSEQNTEYNDYHEKRNTVRKLQMIKDNIDQTLHREPNRQHEKTVEKENEL